jgi:hypothetical protein
VKSTTGTITLELSTKARVHQTWESSYRVFEGTAEAADEVADRIAAFVGRLPSSLQMTLCGAWIIATWDAGKTLGEMVSTKPEVAVATSLLGAAAGMVTWPRRRHDV